MRHMRHPTPTRWLITPHPASDTNKGTGKPISIDVELPLREQMDFKRTDKTSNGHVRPMSAPHPDGQTNRLQQIFNEPSRLPRAHAEQGFHGQTGLDRGIAELLLPTAPAARRAASRPCPDQTRSQAIRVASVRYCMSTSSRSCISSGPKCSYLPAIVLDSRDESPAGFV